MSVCKYLYRFFVIVLVLLKSQGEKQTKAIARLISQKFLNTHNGAFALAPRQLVGQRNATQVLSAWHLLPMHKLKVLSSQSIDCELDAIL